MSVFKQRIERLRVWMRTHGASACVVPQSDPHLSEYIEPHWQLRAWFSGFTGSAGMLVVTPDEAALWTDSRYYIQAESQLQGSSVVMMREEKDVAWKDWLNVRVPLTGKVVADARLFSCRQWRDLAGLLPMRDDAGFEDLWEDRPPLSYSKAFVLPLRLTGVEAAAKLHYLREELSLRGDKRFLLASLDCIAWLLNLRAADLQFSPLLRSYLLVGAHGGELFADARAFDDKSLSYLESLHIRVSAYEALQARLEALQKGCLWGDFREIPAAVTRWSEVSHVANPVFAWKARKNAAELEAFHYAMLQDGVMWVKFLIWLQGQLEQGSRFYESDVVDMLRQLKNERKDCWGESFESIVAMGDHGAIVHYKVNPETDRLVTQGGLLLIDTGTQYAGATTDMTRTLSCGGLTQRQRRDYTQVMRSHIALARAVFPKGTTGAALDGIARQPMWENGLDFGHGTGHGVGAMLHVHEDPVRISWRSQFALDEGMVSSDEPGVYREGSYGIRLENMLSVEKADETEFGCFLKFNVLTLCPFDVSVLLPDDMTDAEKAWLNEYHHRVKEALKPHLSKEEYEWLNRYAYEI